MIDWIQTKYKIWRYHWKWGWYKVPELTIERYENFEFNPDDKVDLDRINYSGVTISVDAPTLKRLTLFKTKR